MEPATEQPSPATTPEPTGSKSPTTVPEPADPKRPKVLSVSQPEQPKLSKPRILHQVQSIPPVAITTVAQSQIATSIRQQNQIGGSDPKSEADWTEQTLSQAEQDAEEQRMANDVTSAFSIPATQLSNPAAEKPQDGQAAPKIEPKSVHGVLYAIKGFADSVSRKLAGK